MRNKSQKYQARIRAYDQTLSKESKNNSEKRMAEQQQFLAAEIEFDESLIKHMKDLMKDKFSAVA